MATLEQTYNEETYQSFYSWYRDKFIGRNGGKGPIDSSKWFKSIVLSHSNIRKQLHGTRAQFKVQTTDKINQSVMDSALPKVNTILEIIPNYLEDYGMDKNDLLKPDVKLGSHNSIKIGKHVTRYFKSNTSDYSSSIYASKLKLIEQK